MKTYQTVTVSIHPYYEIRQKLLRDICNELNLKMFFPNYHGKKGDAGTVIIDTKDIGNGVNQICHFESTDTNGNINWIYLNRGVIDIRGADVKEQIKKYILDRINEEDYKLYGITKEN